MLHIGIRGESRWCSWSWNANTLNIKIRDKGTKLKKNNGKKLKKHRERGEGLVLLCCNVKKGEREKEKGDPSINDPLPPALHRHSTYQKFPSLN